LRTKQANGGLGASEKTLYEPPFPFLEAKLNPHLGRGAGVPRAALLDQLHASSGTPVVSVIASPGYGKTAFLAQWAERDPRPFVWLSIDQRDNHPVVLLANIAAALDRAEPIDPAVFDALRSPGASLMETVLPLLGAALSAKALPVVIVLDDVHLLQNPVCLDAVAALTEHLPQGSQLAIANRGEPPLLLARLRAEGRLVEIVQDDLAMDRDEAKLLLRNTGVDLGQAEVAELVRRTEGWPVALYLAALSLKSGESGNGAVALSGGDRFLVDYLQSVLLSRLPPRVVSFLTHTSVLDRMSGPLCDSVLGRAGSAYLLESLARSHLLVVPLDSRRQWYRYHHLFRELLREDLERWEPELVRDLTLRAAEWCEDNNLPEDAIEYAMAAGDADRAARLVVNVALAAHHDGRIIGLQRWFDWFDDNELIELYAAIAVLGAWLHALAGHSAAAERWADAAERGAAEHGSSVGMLPDGSPSIQGWLALLRAVLCRDGIQQMRTDAQVAVALIPTGSPWQATAHLLLGVSLLLAGDQGSADRLLAEAAEAGEAAGTDAATMALVERSVSAISQGEWTRAEILAERARSIVRRTRREEYPSSVLLSAVAARLAIHRGNMPGALEDLARAQELRARITRALPFYAVQTRLEVVRAYIALTDVAAARTVLAEVDELLLREPDLGVLRQEADQLRMQLDTMRVNAIGASMLTAAELRLLNVLGTHHSFREIGERLYLSRHTVKSQAMSIYRKFGVSSRSAAIQQAYDLGLLAE
jgi:LuxR family transcriptional regulator, maltose regulon positive regulatory protein